MKYSKQYWVPIFFETFLFSSPLSFFIDHNFLPFDHYLLFTIVIMANHCPNPCCDFTYSNSRYLSQHFNSLRGQHCFAVQQSIASSVAMPSGRCGGRMASSMAIHEYQNNTHNRNAPSLSSLITTFNFSASSTLEDPITTATAANTNDHDIAPVVNDDDAALALGHNDDIGLYGNPDDAQETADDSFMYTTHQIMVAKLLSMLDTWNAPNYCFQQIVEWYEEARKNMFPLLATLCHVMPTSM